MLNFGGVHPKEHYYHNCCQGYTSIHEGSSFLLHLFAIYIMLCMLRSAIIKSVVLQENELSIQFQFNSIALLMFV